jgi:hypothetical protein
MSSKTITVDMLQRMCKEMSKMGLGDKKILISNDDEGNGYHELFFTFTQTDKVLTEDDASYMLPFGVDYENAVKNYIILG